MTFTIDTENNISAFATPAEAAGAMKKAGYPVESFKPEGGERTYRINQ